MLLNEIFLYEDIYEDIEYQQCFIYRHCTLLNDFGPFHKGDEFSKINIDYFRSEISFETYDKKVTIDIEINYSPRVKTKTITKPKQAIENLQDTLMRLSLDSNNVTFEKRVALLDIPSQISKLINSLKLIASKGEEYTTLKKLPFDIIIINYNEYEEFADYLSKILQIGVYYYNPEHLWVFYWYDISERGDSLPYPEISKLDLEIELRNIEHNIRVFHESSVLPQKL